jgi:uncharacterized protein YkwD
MNRVAFGFAAAAFVAMLAAAASAPAEPGSTIPGSATGQIGSVTTTVGAAAASVAATVASPAHAAGPARVAAVELTTTESAFVRAINETRRERGLAPLTVNQDLVRAARFHSTDMVDRGYFEHGTVSRRLTRFGIKTGAVGENLGWRSTHRSAVPKLIDMWLRSPPHRAILLSPRFRTVGVGTGTGSFQGWAGAIVVTADFWSGPAA